MNHFQLCVLYIDLTLLHVLKVKVKLEFPTHNLN